MDSKFDSKGARIIAAQLYLAKGLRRNPAKMIKFIRNNRDYFPTISDKVIEDLKKEKNITEEDIDKYKDINFADINSEDDFEEELIKRAEKLEIERKTKA